MSGLSLLALTALVASLLAGAGTWQVQNWRFESKEKERIEAQLEKDRNDRRAVGVVAKEYEDEKTKERIKYVTITKTVDRFIDRPVYKNMCMDQDGIDAINGVVK